MSTFDPLKLQLIFMPLTPIGPSTRISKRTSPVFFDALYYLFYRDCLVGRTFRDYTSEIDLTYPSIGCEGDPSGFARNSQ